MCCIDVGNSSGGAGRDCSWSIEPSLSIVFPCRWKCDWNEDERSRRRIVALRKERLDCGDDALVDAVIDESTNKEKKLEHCVSRRYEAVLGNLGVILLGARWLAASSQLGAGGCND